MDVLIVTELFPPHADGGGWSTYHLANALNEREKINISVTAINETTSFPKYPVERAYYDIVKEIRKRSDDYDIIQGQHVLTVPPLRFIDKPTVGTIRGYWPVCYRGTLRDGWGNNHKRCGPRCITSSMMDFSLHHPLSHKIRKRLTRGVDVLAARSEFVEDRLNDHGFNNTEVMYNFVPDDFGEDVEPEGEGDVLFVGRLVKHKGPDLFLDAAHLAQKSIDNTFTVLGDGPMRETLEERAPGRVSFKGHVPYDEVKARMKGASAVVSPSLSYEPLARVIIESAALDTPVITTQRGGNSEVVPQEQAIEPSPEALSHKIVDLAETGGVSELEVPDKDEIIDKWVQTYQEVI